MQRDYEKAWGKFKSMQETLPKKYSDQICFLNYIILLLLNQEAEGRINIASNNLSQAKGMIP